MSSDDLPIAVRLLLAAACLTVSMKTSRADDTRADRPPSPALPEPAAAAPMPTDLPPQGDLFIVLGAAGAPEYVDQFRDWGRRWREAGEQGGWRCQTLGSVVDAAPDGDQAKQSLRTALQAAASESTLPLWIVLIGHGTDNGRVAKFNLAGEDVSDQELSDWLSPLSRPVAILNTSSASGAMLPALSAPGRVVVVATKGGQEVNFARFGGYLAAALTEPEADLDKDGQVSLLEAFLRAARQTAEFYEGANRLATEHALIDDNGDQRGSRPEAFAGIRPVREKDGADALDGYFAHQWTLIPSAEERRFPPELRRRRDDLELSILRLRDQKDEYALDDYYSRLEPLLLEMARLYEAAETGERRE